jgi:hypothetical protein
LCRDVAAAAPQLTHSPRVSLALVAGFAALHERVGSIRAHGARLLVPAAAVCLTHDVVTFGLVAGVGGADGRRVVRQHVLPPPQPQGHPCSRQVTPHSARTPPSTTTHSHSPAHRDIVVNITALFINFGIVAAAVADLVLYQTLLKQTV